MRSMRAGKRIALIPARSGSKRLPNKAIRLLNGHPIISYSICSCIDTFIFDEIIVSSDSEEYLEIARQYGAKTRLRPKEISGDHSPDVEWVKDVLDNLDYDPAYFAIIRPTNPFRTSETINKAWARFCLHGEADSLRAVEKTKHSPYKSWVLMSETRNLTRLKRKKIRREKEKITEGQTIRVSHGYTREGRSGKLELHLDKRGTLQGMRNLRRGMSLLCYCSEAV